MPRRVLTGTVVSDKMNKTVVVRIDRRVMFELDGVTPEVAEEAFRLAAAKLPVQTRMVSRVVG